MAKQKIDEKDSGKKAKLKDVSKMTPLEKARAAKKAGGKAGAKTKAKKKAGPTWQAPEDFKPHFLEILFKTDKDGLLSSAIKATRYKGRYDPNAEDKKKDDLGSYDPKTLSGILSRFSMVTFATNPDKRLPAKTTFKALLRVNRVSADNTLKVLFKGLKKGVLLDSGKVKSKELTKDDPEYRMFRKAVRILPAAFSGVLQPPKKVRGKKVDADDE